MPGTIANDLQITEREMAAPREVVVDDVGENEVGVVEDMLVDVNEAPEFIALAW